MFVTATKIALKFQIKSCITCNYTFLKYYQVSSTFLDNPFLDFTVVTSKPNDN